MTNVKKLGLYIHIPFCRAKCNYCDFNSYPGKEDLMESYFHALEAEIGLCAPEAGDSEFGTVFIGGGTPTLAGPALIYRLMNACRSRLNISGDAEISMEANPGTLTFEKLAGYRACGANRLSVGLQAWQDGLLKELGRIHTSGEFEENFRLARKAGFRNINVDLIFGIPGQKINEWSETVSKVVGLGPEHISCYSLKIEEGTVFGDRLESGLMEEPDDELDRKMYWYAVNRLEKSGYRHYEISNFAKPGMECRHNLVYWTTGEYLGIGAGAHSFMNGVRFNNVYGVEEYIDSIGKGKKPRENEQPIGRTESMSEYMILGLRLVDGIRAGDFKARFGEDPDAVYGEKLAALERKQLLERDGDRIRLTAVGLDFGNTVFMEFL